MLMSARHIRTATIHALAAMLSTVAISVAETAQPSSVPAYLDPLHPVSVRIDDLISKMTLEEKAPQLTTRV
jgi:beta-glucosidase